MQDKLKADTNIPKANIGKDVLNLTGEFWQYVEMQNTKVSERVHKWLDRDKLSGIYVGSNNIFWVEIASYMDSMPNYVLQYIKQWCRQRGYKYLHDIKEED